MNQKYLLIALSLLFTSSVYAEQTSQDYWIEYNVIESVRKTENDPWIVRYANEVPFGVRLGYGGSGVILRGSANSDSDQPNCYEFTFTPIKVNGLSTLQQKLEITKYRGNSYCYSEVQTKIIHVASFDALATQGSTSVLQLAFLDGDEIKIELRQSWKFSSSTAHDGP